MNFAQKFLYPINIMPTDRQVGVSRFSFKTSAGAACCGRDGMVDIPDLKSGGRMPVRVQVPPPAPCLSNKNKTLTYFALQARCRELVFAR